MKAQISLLVSLLFGSMTLDAIAVTRYVDLNCSSPTPPHTSWFTAATNIQDAIDAATDGDLVLVTNGVYRTGGKVAVGALTNRVAIDKAITVRSVSGPAVTVIEGYTVPVTTFGDSAIRCVFLASNAVLSGFTLTNGATHSSESSGLERIGGGVLGQGVLTSQPDVGVSAIVTNCVVVGNSAQWRGGGGCLVLMRNCLLIDNTAGIGGGAAYESRIDNCIIRSNTAPSGGGAMYCTLRNCTVFGNQTIYSEDDAGGTGGGISVCLAYNSIVINNSAVLGNDNYGGYYGGRSLLNYCCTSPLPEDGVGNITTDPLFVDAVAGDLHLSPNSPCIDFGNNSYAPSGSDFEGNQRITGAGVDMGAYEYQGPPHLPTTLYVDVSSTNPIAPYTNWATAANVIQDALNAARNSDEVIVTNGVYQVGGSTTIGGASNRVVIIRNVALRSVNGPAVTVIEGYQIPGDIYGEEAVRCAYLDNGAVLSGFTLTNGATWRHQFEYPLEKYFAGGAWCASTNEVITNCIIVNNRADGAVGGIYRGTVYNSLISSNWGRYGGGGVSSGVIYRCVFDGNYSTYGGGADWSTLNHCVLTGNSAYIGGAVNGGLLSNCVLTNNSAYLAGAAVNATLINCTIVGNSAADAGGGVDLCVLKNSILHANSAATNANYISMEADYSCTAPLPPSGIGNFTNAPLFVNFSSGNLRLQTNSPCIDTGSNALATGDRDLDGRPRINGGTVDIGAYEFQGAGMGEFIGWLQEFGLATDGSADFADADDDKMNNYGEWRADTIPTDTLSVLRMIAATNSATGANVTWQSVATRTYRLERSVNLGLPSTFQTIATSIAGAVGTTTFADTSATNSGPYFYRVGVE